MLRETEGTSRGVSVSDSHSLKPKLEKERYMETISIHDVGLVLAFFAIALAPRAIATCQAVRK
jgi:hypothetical protein